MNINERNMEGRRVDGKDMRCMILHGGCWWQEWDVLKSCIFGCFDNSK